MIFIIDLAPLLLHSSSVKIPGCLFGRKHLLENKEQCCGEGNADQVVENILYFTVPGR
jgi:hypothetical protein